MQSWQQTLVEQNPHLSVRKMSQTLNVSSAIVSCHWNSIRKAKNLMNRSFMSLMSIKNLECLKSAQCFVCVTPIVFFLTKLSLVTKSDFFIIIINDLANDLIVMSSINFLKAKVSLAKNYGNCFLEKKLEHYCLDLLQSPCIFKLHCKKWGLS